MKPVGSPLAGCTYAMFPFWPGNVAPAAGTITRHPSAAIAPMTLPLMSGSLARLIGDSKRPFEHCGQLVGAGGVGGVGEGRVPRHPVHDPRYVHVVDSVIGQ